MVDFDENARTPDYDPDRQIDQRYPRWDETRRVPSPEAVAQARAEIEAEIAAHRAGEDLSAKVRGVFPPEPPFTVAAHPRGGSVAILTIHGPACPKIDGETCTCGADETWANFRTAVNES